MSHTPGPWRWGNGSYLSLVGRAPDGSGTRQVFFGEYGSELSNGDDARLIQHAPELLEMLRRFADHSLVDIADLQFEAFTLLKKLKDV